MLFRVLAWLILLHLPALAYEGTLVRVGDSWKYFKGTNAPSALRTAWQQITFDDSTWLTGVGGFSIGQQYDENTLLFDMPTRYLSAFFRKKFTVNELQGMKWLTLRIDYDDGFLAYLNGTEVARRGFASGADVSFDTPAASLGRTWGEEINLTAFTNLLVTGENVLAIELHNSSLGNSTAVLVTELVANFTRGPFVQNVSSNHAQVIWRTPAPADTKLEFGTSSALGNALIDSNRVTTHVVTLTNLPPDSVIFYRATSVEGTQAVAGAIESFKTLKTRGAVSFMVFADSGTGSLGQFQIADVIRRAAPDLVLHVGDVMYYSFNVLAADMKCLSIYQPHKKSTPYFFAFGNHDLYSGDSPFLETFYLPTNSLTGTEHFYSFDHGDVHFSALFVPVRALDALFPNYYLGDDTLQFRWLTNDLARTSKPWKILFFHCPLNTCGPHRYDSDQGVFDRLELQRLLLPVARQYGVQLVLNGHDHTFQRFAPMNGVHGVVTGGGGASPYAFVERDPANAQFWSAYHGTKITVTGDTLRLEALDTNGVVFDGMTIQRLMPPPRIYQSSWHSPALESKPPDDGDGNINGQAFDLIGAPIPTVPGGFSNLGRVYANNDSRNLYIGFEQGMIYGDNNIFLFIDSPRLSGVTSMAGIGNGRLDPDGEGADGLDYLENLSFNNFTPAVGCILGDEFADSPYRNFVRPNLALNVGQGVFQLTRDLSDLPGARFQQFNRSPQRGAVPGEQNADFIELAVPLDQLGGLLPGDIIKVGAVVGGPGFDPSVDRQTRELDSSFLGNSLSGSGQGPVVLEGLSVRLALNPDPDQDGLTSTEEAALGTDPSKPDTDGDGLLDGWEVNFGLNPLASAGKDGRDGDPDGDGLDNAHEQTAGTNPQNAASTLRLDLVLLTNHMARFSWGGVVGRRYQLEYSTHLNSGFAVYAGTDFPRTATSTNESFIDRSSNATTGTRFYRLRVVP